MTRNVDVPRLADQPEHIQEMFDSRASGREVTPEQLYDKVPDHLKDNPDEVSDYLNGNEEIGIDSRDVSRHESGQNGGEYTNENISFERSSDNRSAQGQNMTSERLVEMESNNAADAAVIEDFHTNDLDFELANDLIADSLAPVAVAFIFGGIRAISAALTSSTTYEHRVMPTDV